MVHWVHARAVINDTPFPARAMITEIQITRQRSDYRKTGNPQEHAETTSKCTIPFGHPPQSKTTRFADTHCITLKRGLDRLNGNWDSQGEALSKHELSRIYHELAIKIHRLIVFHRLIAKKAQPPATPSSSLNNLPLKIREFYIDKLFL